MTPIFYFGPMKEAGHYLWYGRRRIDFEEARTLGFPCDRSYGTTLRTERSLDGGYCTGYIEGNPYRRSKAEIEGHALFAHEKPLFTYEKGLTILGLWDRSVDTRPGCCSTYVALGLHGFAEMMELCEKAYPERWNLLVDRVPVQLIEIMGVDRKYLQGLDLAGVEVVS